MFTTESRVLVPTAYSIMFKVKAHLPSSDCESTDQGPEQKKRDVCEENISHSATDKILEHAPSICFGVTSRILRPKEHKINKGTGNVSR